MSVLIDSATSNIAVHCASISSGNSNGNANGNVNANGNLIKSLGWFPKTKSIIKFLYEGHARCYQCYEPVIYEEIAYSRIISNHNRDNRDTKNNKYVTIDQLSQFERLYKIAALCNKCIACSNSCDGVITNIKLAPRGYGDIISDLLINERFDILAIDIEKIGDAKLKVLLDKINYSLFNYNEKLLIYNALVSENAKLKNNLDLEIEKHKILYDHKSKNQELQNDIRNYLVKSTKTIFAEYQKVIDEQIAKYNDLNCAVKYNIPECKVCMMREVRLALECGHLLCIECNKNILEEQRKKENEMNEPVRSEGDEGGCNGYPCPFCKTYSSKFLQIYL